LRQVPEGVIHPKLDRIPKVTKSSTAPNGPIRENRQPGDFAKFQAGLVTQPDLTKIDL